jgi:hypothetical protein
VRQRNKPGKDQDCAYTARSGLESRGAGNALKAQLEDDGSFCMYTLMKSEQTKIESRATGFRAYGQKKVGQYAN